MNELENLKTELEGVNSTVRLALNQKPKNHKRIEMNRAEVKELLNKQVQNIQSKIIGYYALSVAVKEHKDTEAITKRAMELFEETILSLYGVKVEK